MKFGQPILSSELSGSLGGVVASSARGGVGYFRVRRRPGNPRSSAQSSARLILAGLSAAWLSTLTLAQRAAWAGIAPSGSSGIDVYVKANANLILGGSARVDVAPASVSLAANPVTAVSFSTATDMLSFSNTTFAADLHINVYVNATAQSPSRLSQQRHTKYVGTEDLSAAGVNTISLASLPGITGAAVGQVFYVRFVQFNDDGQVAVEQVERVTIAA